MSYSNISITGPNTELNTAVGAVCAEAISAAGFNNTSFATESSNEPVIANSASALDVLRATHPGAFAEANISVTSFNGEGGVGGGSGDISSEEDQGQIGTSLADAEAQALGEKLAEAA